MIEALAHSIRRLVKHVSFLVVVLQFYSIHYCLNQHIQNPGKYGAHRHL
jgi:hypothetical protein